MTTFLRRVWHRYSKLGKKRKKKQKWNKPKGRHNKMREKRKGYPAIVSVGYKKNRVERMKIADKIPVMIYNLKDLGKVGKNEMVVIVKIGRRKKTEIVKKAEEMKAHIYNFKKSEENKK